MQKFPYGQLKRPQYVKRMQVADFHQSVQEDLLLILILNVAGAQGDGIRHLYSNVR